jgi:chemotaxis protein MotB
MKNMKLILVPAVCLSMVATGCVSTKKYKGELARNEALKMENDKLSYQLSACQSEKEKQASRINSMEQEMTSLRANSTTMLGQLKDLSVISAAQSESIRKSLENISTKDALIMDMQSAMARKDSLNMNLALNLKGALNDVNDQDVNIKIEGSAVFISISDKMLFKTGSYEITPTASSVLAKVAAVIKAQPDVQFMVEGHTDNKPIATDRIRDNWDLSVLRASSIVRDLQKNHGVDPARMIAAGRSEYVPVSDNDSDDGRSKNRRTRIVILPQLDQFFKLLEPKK